MIKGTTLTRNIFLPTTKVEDSKGMLTRIEEEKDDDKDKTQTALQSLKDIHETLRKEHDSFKTSVAHERTLMQNQIKSLEVRQNY